MTSSSEVKIIHDKEPIRLFKSDFLEFFSHVHPLTILAIWTPVIALFLILAVARTPSGNATALNALLGVATGVFLWTLAEYMLHRFVFHFRPRSAWQKRLAFLSHGVHHAQPKCKTRLVMPPAVSIPLALVFYAAFYLFIGILLARPHWTYSVFAGFLTGYLVYDMIHYATHHFPMRKGIMKALKRHHLKHHYKSPNQRYGVSSPLWDYAFGTQPKS